MAGQKRIVIKSNGEEQVHFEELNKLVEKYHGQNLPAPLIYPPIFNVRGSEELANEIKNTFGSKAEVRIEDEEY
ncbi:hypothetical protein PT974_01438 [Cladobotryum mycophilum]|uniref:Uncharacterized protein n=1 Tax=Cladobotryum mycophilum TaxID=491253 RepID=A0ABR0T4Z8_9HYPO